MELSNKKTGRKLFRDPSTWVLIIANLVVIALAVVQNWSLIDLLWVYWTQSVIIGIINVGRILSLQNYSTEGFKVNGRSVLPTEKTKKQVAGFFAFHYGFFHLVYAIFLSVFTHQFFNSTIASVLPYILLAAIIFLVNHLFSYKYNRPRDEKKQNIGRVMFFPYLRIIPMHITIIAGGALLSKGQADAATGAVVLFLFLKTIADVIMHLVEHKKQKPTSMNIKYS